jgi:DNA-binding LytR/AlgR family response regulator
MTILVIEDEPNASDLLVRLIKKIKPTAICLDGFDSVKRSIKWLSDNPQPDLIFMDIQLADGLSFLIFEHVEIKCPVIFTTAYDEYALRAFKVNSIDYILKPVDEASLQLAFDKYFHLIQIGAPTENSMEHIHAALHLLTKKYKERFVIKTGDHLKSIATSDILFFFSLEKTTFAQTNDGRKHILDFTLEQLESNLAPESFFRINRKYFIHISSILEMTSFTNSRLKIKLKNSDDKDIVVARERVQEFKNWLDR